MAALPKSFMLPDEKPFRPLAQHYKKYIFDAADLFLQTFYPY
jgi:hypothetical protein